MTRQAYMQAHAAMLAWSFPVLAVSLIGYLLVMFGMPLVLSLLYCIARWSRGRKCG
jgi:uncharacterized membrane protein